MSWPTLGDWWTAEVRGDGAYEAIVTPMLLEVLSPLPGEMYLDLGSGEGRVMRAVTAAGAIAHGLDISRQLAARSSEWGPVVVGELPGLDFMADDSYDGAYCVLVLEHLADHEIFFRSVSRVVKDGGPLALVMNHPTWTAPGSTPITEPDGEVLWRSGRYFGEGSTEEPAGNRSIMFHHRTMASLLNAAAVAGWFLERMIEAPHHEQADQAGIPRLLACRWRLLP